MIRPPRYGCPARTLRLRLLLVPQDETFPWCNLSSRPASPLCGASFLPASPLRHHHHAVTPLRVLEKTKVCPVLLREMQKTGQKGCGLISSV
jgi:hypothetical protein